MKKKYPLPGGCMGKILWIDLDRKTIKEKNIRPETYHHYLSGIGLGAKIIYDEQKPGLPPFHKDQIFGVVSGLLNGTGASFAGRWMAVGRSPLTGTWGEANCGGNFAQALKLSGYDGIFFTGQSRKNPVYLLVNGDEKKLVDATELWGKDSFETESLLQEQYKAEGSFKIISIGPGGERQALLAGIVNDYGRLAARSGLGALMGSKKLKAVCIRPVVKKTEIKDRPGLLQRIKEFNRAQRTYKHLWLNKLIHTLSRSPFVSGIIRFLYIKTKILHKIIDEEVERFVMDKYGTVGALSHWTNTGISPVKNWGGISYRDFPARRARRISSGEFLKFQKKRGGKTLYYGCYSCPLKCGGIINNSEYNREVEKNKKKKAGPFLLDEKGHGAHRPEYETACGFGNMLLTDDIYQVVKVNDMLNRAGLDTISVSVTVAWAFEAFEMDILTTTDTGGLILSWKKPMEAAVIKLVEQIAAGDGIGAVLQHGVKYASEFYYRKTGKQCSGFAMHSFGQELPMYDTRQKETALTKGAAYELEPAPGRHYAVLCGVVERYREKQPDQTPGEILKDGSCLEDILNGLGICNFAMKLGIAYPLTDFANLTTGWNKTIDEYLETGRRMKIIRHLFNIREGIDPLAMRLPARATGSIGSALTPEKNIRREIDEVKREYYRLMGYDPDTGKPLPETLEALDVPGKRAIMR